MRFRGKQSTRWLRFYCARLQGGLFIGKVGGDFANFTFLRGGRWPIVLRVGWHDGILVGDLITFPV